MENIVNLKAKIDTLPSTVKANAAKLVEEMSTVIEGIGDETVAWKPAFLKLVQGTTDRGSIPKGTAIGDFVLGEEKIEQPLKFIPIRIWDARQYWDPDQTSNKMLCWSPDAKQGSMFGECKTCEHGKWVENEGSACGKIKSVLAISADLSKVFIINFAKSNYKIGMELKSLMEKAMTHSYMRVYGLSSSTSTTSKNVENYKIEVLDDKQRRTPTEYVEFLRELFDIVSGDRKTMLDAFYQNARARQERLALSGNAPVAIENKSTEDVAEVKVIENKSAVSELAKGYTV